MNSIKSSRSSRPKTSSLVSCRTSSVLETQRAEPKSNIEIRVASTPEEMEHAFRIGYDVYYKEGFIPKSAHGIRVTAGHLRPTTAILVAYVDGSPVGTLSLYEDSEIGIPSEKVWPREIKNLRKDGKTLIEIGTLMIQKTQPKISTQVYLKLFRFAWLYAKYAMKGGTICSFVQLKHLWFYQRMLNFKPIGSAPRYECNGMTMHNCVFMFMDLVGAEEDFKARFNKWGNSPRNLYYQFVIHQRAEIDAHLNSEIKRWSDRDWKGNKEKFQKFISSRPSTPVTGKKA